MTRRELIRLASWLGFAPFFAGASACVDDEPVDPGEQLPEYDYDGPPGPDDLFSHGLASGDPLQSAVILWTRVSPAGDDPVDVFWEVALDPGFEERVSVGWFMTDRFADFTVKVDATGLEAGTTYYYRFQALGRRSPVGRTRTTPEGAAEQLRFAVLSCGSYTAGYFHAYRRVAERLDLDAVIHLGDYIYEGGGRLASGQREHDPPHEIVSLDDYRRRYAQYRGDADLQAAHQQHPFIAVWDDHETANNSWSGGAQGHNRDSDGDWASRRAAATQAYAEWMPIRESADGHIYRSSSFGERLELIMLDTRIWGRDEQVALSDEEALADAARSLLGDEQEAWLAAQLRQSTAQWKVVGQQVMMGHLKAVGEPNSEGGGQYVNTDQWDGYPASRERFFDLLQNEGLDDVVVLTGDIHSSWANDLAADPNNPEAYDPETGEGALAVELVTPGVTSGIEFNEASLGFLTDVIAEENPHIKFVDLRRRGYLVLDVTADRAQAAWYHIEDVTDAAGGNESLGEIYATRAGQNRLVAEDEPAQPLSPPPPAAPSSETI